MIDKTWPTKKLGEVAEILIGGTPRRNVSKYWTGGSNLWVTVSELNGKKIVNTNENITDLGVKNSNVKLIPKGTTLLSFKLSLGKVGIAGKDLYTNEAVAALLPKNGGVTNEWFYYILPTIDFEKYVSGAAKGKTLNKRILGGIKIPVPPKSTQQKIVERLDTIRKAQELNEKQISLANELFQSLLCRELKPKKGWKIQTLGKVAHFKRGPFGGSLKKEIFVKKGYKVYEQGNVINNDFSKGNYFITEEKYEDMTRFSIQPGDIIISCSGTIGKVVIVPPDAQPGIINQALLKITPIVKLVSSPFLKLIIESKPIQNKLVGRTRGSAIKNVASVREIKRIAIPIPPIKTQHQIVEKLSAVQDYKKKLSEQKELLQELFESVLDRSMKGELI